MKRRAIIFGAVTVLLLVVAVYFWGPSSVPQGQPPLLMLSSENFNDFGAAFDADANAPRLVLLLSPT